MPTQYLISEELADAILDYLGDRPYRDVCKLINALHGMQEQQPDPEIQKLHQFLISNELWLEYCTPKDDQSASAS